MLLSFLCLLSLVPGVSSTIQTRSDDVDLQSLMTLVQQQAATIQSLQARMTALENNANRLKNIGKQVAFSAQMSASPVNVGSNSPFIFDKVVTNIGNNYNNHTGIFIAPSGGVYVFYFMMINYINAPSIHAAIEKDGVVLGIGTSDSVGDYNSYDDGSLLVTTHLRKGDQVYVKRSAGGNVVYGGPYCNFSGFILVPDP